MVRIAVIGAGVVGLTTATLLQDALPEASVTIIADRFLKDTMSDVSAGIFLPWGHFPGSTPEITRKWLKDSYNYYKKIYFSSNEDETGIKRIPGFLLSRVHPSMVKNAILKSTLDFFRPCSQEELTGLNINYGSYYITILTECGRYLPYLTSKFQKQGGTMMEHHVESLEQLADEDYDLVCNCSGVGARFLFHDANITPLRGQVFKVKAPWIKHAYHLDSDTYVIPGFDAVTIGGTRQIDSYNEKVCKHDSRAIWERALELLPSLKEAEIMTERVELRPYRHHIRVEKEILELDSGKTLKVVHNYGHGEYSVMSAPGTSMHAVILVRDLLIKNNSKL